MTPPPHRPASGLPLLSGFRRLPVALQWGAAAGAIVLAIMLAGGAGGAAAPARPAAPEATPGPATEEYFIRSYDELTSSPAAEQPPETVPEVGLDLVLKLLAVVAIIYACGYVLRRAGFPRTGVAPGGHRIRVIESLSLGPQRSIAVVEVAGRRLAVGMTNQSIQLLAELDRVEPGGERAPFDPLTSVRDVAAGSAGDARLPYLAATTPGPASVPPALARQAVRSAIRRAIGRLDATGPRLCPLESAIGQAAGK